MRSRALPTQQKIALLAPLKSCTEARLPGALSESTGFPCDGIVDALNGSYPALEPLRFLRSTLPFMVSEAEAIVERFSGALPLLVDTGVVSMSRGQVCSVLACMFFGLLSAPLAADGETLQDWPNTSMKHLLAPRGYPSVLAKLRCVLQYFSTMQERCESGAPSTGRVYFRRIAVGAAAVPDFGSCLRPILPLVPHATGVIEDASGCLHVDFANKRIGGGVLSGSAVQEEIRFSVSPECLVARALCPDMNNREAIVITGSEVFSKTTGYSRGLAFAGPHADPTPRMRDAPRVSAPVVDVEAAGAAAMALSELALPPTAAPVAVAAPLVPSEAPETAVETLDPDTLQSCIVAIDALHYYRCDLVTQIAEENFNRDLIKAFVGFSVAAPEVPFAVFPAVSTGKWGCGAFNGHVAVKTLQQWLAASAAKRSVEFFLFDSAPLAPLLTRLSESLIGAGATVGDVYRAVAEWRRGFFSGDAQRRAEANSVEGVLKAVVGLAVEGKAAPGPSSPKRPRFAQGAPPEPTH